MNAVEWRVGGGAERLSPSTSDRYLHDGRTDAAELTGAGSFLSREGSVEGTAGFIFPRVRGDCLFIPVRRG